MMPCSAGRGRRWLSVSILVLLASLLLHLGTVRTEHFAGCAYCDPHSASTRQLGHCHDDRDVPDHDPSQVNGTVHPAEDADSRAHLGPGSTGHDAHIGVVVRSESGQQDDSRRGVDIACLCLMWTSGQLRGQRSSVRRTRRRPLIGTHSTMLSILQIFRF